MAVSWARLSKPAPALIMRLQRRCPRRPGVGIGECTVIISAACGLGESRRGDLRLLSRAWYDEYLRSSTSDRHIARVTSNRCEAFGRRSGVSTGTVSLIDELVDRTRGVAFEESREATIGKQLPARLAACAIICFVVGVPDALHGRLATRAGLAELSMDGHLFAKRRHLAWKSATRFFTQTIDPKLERGPRRLIEALPLLVLEFLRQREWREHRGVQNFIGVGIADAAQRMRIGKGALKRMVLTCKCVAKRLQIGDEDVDAAGIHCKQCRFSRDNMQRRATCRAGLGEHERAARKIECGEIVASAERRPRRLPVEATCNHKMHDEPEVAIEADGDPFADPSHVAHNASRGVRDRRIRRS